MIINLYKNKSDPKTVYKNIVLLRGNVDLEIYGECTIDSPVFKISASSIIPDCNYLEVPSWGRKYFAETRVLEGDRAIIICQTDVLTSFFDSCRTSPVIARRSTSAPDIRIEDDRVLKLQKPTIIYRKLGTGFTPSNSNNYILTLAGKHVGI